MKKAFIFCLALALLSLPCVTETQVTTHQSHSEVWKKFTNSYESNLYSVFKAIELKNDVRFMDSLNEFITTSPSLTQYTAQAIYTYSKLGGKDAEQKFDKLLRAEIQTDPNVITDQIYEKSFALDYMKKLGMKPSDETLILLRKEMPKLTAAKSFTRFVCSLVKQDVKFTNEETAIIRKYLTEKWNDYEAEDLNIIGIQPDWEKLFKAVQINDKRELLNHFLLGGNEESKRKYLETCGDLTKPSGKFWDLNLLIGATVRDKVAVNQLLKIMDYDQAKFIENKPQYFPDEILIKADRVFKADIGHKHHLFLTYGSFLRECKKRGLDSKINETIQSLKKEMEKFSKSSEEFLSIGTLVPFADYDPIYCLNWLAELAQKRPSDDTPGFYIMIITMHYKVFGKEKDPEIEKWAREHPEEIAKAIKILVRELPLWGKAIVKLGIIDIGDENTKDNPMYSFQMTSMLFLPDDVFKQYFTRYSNDYYPPETALVMDYFGAYWRIPK